VHHSAFKSEIEMSPYKHYLLIAPIGQKSIVFNAACRPGLGHFPD